MICKHCQTEFEPDGNRKVFCSFRCKRLHNVLLNRYRVKKELIEAAGATCVRCGFSDPRALQFHHRDPSQKEFKLSADVCKSKERMIAEAQKCDLLCANCHQIEHAKWWAWLDLNQQLTV